MMDPAWLSFLLIFLGLAVNLAGLIGCVVPVLPGPVLSYLSLLLLSHVRNWTVFSGPFLMIMAVLVLIASLADYFLPLRGARKYGASRWGITGSLLGMLIGVFFFPPFGLFLGAFLGAFAGEILSKKAEGEALRAAWGAFTGTILGTIVKLAYSGTALFFYVKALFT